MSQKQSKKVRAERRKMEQETAEMRRRLAYVKRVRVDEKSWAMYCPVCGSRLCSRFIDYCPHCGAKMDGGEEGADEHKDWRTL